MKTKTTNMCFIQEKANEKKSVTRERVGSLGTKGVRAGVLAFQQTEYWKEHSSQKE